GIDDEIHIFRYEVICILECGSCTEFIIQNQQFDIGRTGRRNQPVSDCRSEWKEVALRGIADAKSFRSRGLNGRPVSLLSGTLKQAGLHQRLQKSESGA